MRRLLRAALVPLVVALAVPGAGAASDPLVEERGGAVIDWRRGTVQATGGAAADHRMPSADAARPGAERRARAAARALLAEALRSLPLGAGRRLADAEITRAVGRARPTQVDYQSNGGALVRLEISFGDWSEGAQTPGADAGAPAAPAAPPLALSLAEGHLAAAPVVMVGGREVALASARYLTAAEIPAGVKPLAIRADRKGRWLLGGESGKAGSKAAANARDPAARPAEDATEFAGRAALVYVHKVLR